MTCCSLDGFGYKTDSLKNIVSVTSMVIAFAAIAGVVMGVLALHNGISTSTALWTQVGLLGATAALTGITVALSGKVKNKMAVLMAVITVLTLPVLFGSLGAVGLIHAHNMLWAATMMCGMVVVGAFLTSMSFIARDCVCPKSEYQQM